MFLTHASSSAVGADQNTKTISVNTSLKECGKERGSVQHVTQRECRYGVWCKQYTGGEFIFISVTQTLPPLPLRESTKSCLFTRHPKKAGTAVGVRIWRNILYIKYSSLPPGSFEQFWRSVCYCLLLPPTRVKNERQKQSYVRSRIKRWCEWKSAYFVQLFPGWV